MIITHHGYDFGIDTADWGRNETSAEKAAGKLEDWLLALDPVHTAALHRALEREDSDSPLAEAAFAAGNQATLDVWREESWVSHPSTGHNCDLYAA